MRRPQNSIPIISVLILIFTILIRIIPISNNHFYFTIDQGRDALYIKDILQGNLTLLGPITDISNLYHGAGWYYLLTPSYLLFAGHPYGAVFSLILIACCIFFLLLKDLPKIISPRIALITVAILTFILPLYETTRFAFNPYLMAWVGILFLLGLTFTRAKPNFFLLSSFATGMVLHSELASLVPFLLTYTIASLVFLSKKRIHLVHFSFGWILVLILFLPHLISELTTNFSQLHAVLNHISGSESVLNVSRVSQIKTICVRIFSNLGQAIRPQIPVVGGILFVLFLAIYLIRKRGSTSDWVRYFLLLTLFTIFWYGTNRGFRPWHLIYLPALSMVTFAIAQSVLPQKISLLILSVVFFFQIIHTASSVKLYLQNTTDPGLMQNQLKTIDWIYEQSAGVEFSVYTYVPSVYDYHYQYLFPWYGLKKYGYLPCEYSTNPGVDTVLYVPGLKRLKEPTHSCPKLFFLTLEPAVTQKLRHDWHEEVSVNSNLISKTKVGEIEIEKRERL